MIRRLFAFLTISIMSASLVNGEPQSTSTTQTESKSPDKKEDEWIVVIDREWPLYLECLKKYEPDFESSSPSVFPCRSTVLINAITELSKIPTLPAAQYVLDKVKYAARSRLPVGAFWSEVDLLLNNIYGAALHDPVYAEKLGKMIAKYLPTIKSHTGSWFDICQEIAKCPGEEEAIAIEKTIWDYTYGKQFNCKHFHRDMQAFIEKESTHDPFFKEAADTLQKGGYTYEYATPLPAASHADVYQIARVIEVIKKGDQAPKGMESDPRIWSVFYAGLDKNTFPEAVTPFLPSATSKSIKIDFPVLIRMARINDADEIEFLKASLIQMSYRVTAHFPPKPQDSVIESELRSLATNKKLTLPSETTMHQWIEHHLRSNVKKRVYLLRANGKLLRTTDKRINLERVIGTKDDKKHPFYDERLTYGLLDLYVMYGEKRFATYKTNPEMNKITISMMSYISSDSLWATLKEEAERWIAFVEKYSG